MQYKPSNTPEIKKDDITQQHIDIWVMWWQMLYNFFIFDVLHSLCRRNTV